MAVDVGYGFELVEVLDILNGSGADLATLDEGGVAITVAEGGNVDARRFDADGDAAAQRLNLAGTAAEVSQLSNGNLVVVTSVGGDARFIVLGPSATTVAGPVQALAPSGALTSFDVTGDVGGGRFAIATSNASGVNIALRTNAGAPQAGVSVAASGTGVSIAALEDGTGGFVVAWHVNIGSSADLYYAVYDADGDTRKAPMRHFVDATDYNRNASVVALNGGGFGIAYEIGDGNAFNVNLARFDSAGAHLGTHLVGSAAAVDGSISATRLSNGMVVVGYIDNDTAQIWKLVEPETGAVLDTGAPPIIGDGPLSLAALSDGRFASAHEYSPGYLSSQVQQVTRTLTSDGDGDIISGDSLKDIVRGGGGGDVIFGRGAADDLQGGEGDDIFGFNTGDAPFGEIIDGGDGADLIIADESINFFAATLISIEAVQFSGDNQVNQRIEARADQIGAGLSSNLVVRGKPDGVSDVLRVVMFADVDVDLSGFSFQNWDSAGAENDRLLIAGDNDNETIIGSSVRDDIQGGGGNDSLGGGLGDDVLTGGPGQDVIGGGDGVDVADYRDKTAPVVLTLNGGFFSAATVGGVAEDTVLNVESVYGGSGADRLTGDALANVLEGGAGADILKGASGIDRLVGGAGVDELRGGDDQDTIVINVGDGLAGEVIDGGEGGVDQDTLVLVGNLNAFNVTLSGIEYLRFQSPDGVLQRLELRADQIGPGFNGGLVTGHVGTDIIRIVMFADTDLDLSAFDFTALSTADNDRIEIVGDDNAETIRGWDWRDDITAGGGNDSVNGGPGDDLISGGAGVDDLVGGPGTDTLDYRDKTSQVVVTLLDNDDTRSYVGGGVEDFIESFESVQGGSGADVLSGNSEANTLYGNGGNDILRSGGGRDTLLGGAGVDFADYRDVSTRLWVYLATGSVSIGDVPSLKDTVSGIEGVLAGSGDDILNGDAFGNTFRGGLGRDSINGAAGVDAVDFRDKTSTVQLTLAGSATAVARVGGVEEDYVANVEIIYGGAASDKLTGDVLDNQLLGNGGNDLLRGGRGADLLFGGAGADTFFFNALSESTAAAAGRDTIRDFSREQGDRVYLALIDANTGLAGNQAFTIGPVGTAGKLQVTAVTPNSLYLVQGDVNGGGADFAILVNSVTAPVAADFVL